MPAEGRSNSPSYEGIKGKRRGSGLHVEGVNQRSENAAHGQENRVGVESGALINE